jgi:hypothetical protein
VDRVLGEGLVGPVTLAWARSSCRECAALKDAVGLTGGPVWIVKLPYQTGTPCDKYLHATRFLGIFDEVLPKSIEPCECSTPGQHWPYRRIRRKSASRTFYVKLAPDQSGDDTVDYLRRCGLQAGTVWGLQKVMGDLDVAWIRVVLERHLAPRRPRSPKEEGGAPLPLPELQLFHSACLEPLPMRATLNTVEAVALAASTQEASTGVVQGELPHKHGSPLLCFSYRVVPWYPERYDAIAQVSLARPLRVAPFAAVSQHLQIRLTNPSDGLKPFSHPPPPPSLLRRGAPSEATAAVVPPRETNREQSATRSGFVSLGQHPPPRLPRDIDEHFPKVARRTEPPRDPRPRVPPQPPTEPPPAPTRRTCADDRLARELGIPVSTQEELDELRSCYGITAEQVACAHRVAPLGPHSGLSAAGRVLRAFRVGNGGLGVGLAHELARLVAYDEYTRLCGTGSTSTNRQVEARAAACARLAAAEAAVAQHRRSTHERQACRN